MSEMYKFWMVWIEGKSESTKKHFTVDEARLEAERLLRLPENRFHLAYILECTSFGVIESLPVTWRTMAERT
jgi:hypothetical protein